MSHAVENANLLIKEQIVQTLNDLSEIELKKVIEYVSFLKLCLIFEVSYSSQSDTTTAGCFASGSPLCRIC
jgi:hypothetical protein